jgi:hypothetical protein
LLARLLLAAAICGAGPTATSFGQQPWKPNRNDDSASWQGSNSLRQSGQASSSNLRQADQLPRPVLSSTEQIGSSVVLRWQKTAPRGSTSSVAATEPISNVSRSGEVQFNSNSSQPVPPAPSFSSETNPLRYTSSDSSIENPVRQAAYQQEFGGSNQSAPQWRSANNRRFQEETEAPKAFDPSNLPDLRNSVEPTERPDGIRLGSESPFGVPSLESKGLESKNPVLQSPDPLDQAEQAPAPPQLTPDDISPLGTDNQRSPVDREKEYVAPPSPFNQGEDSDEDSVKAVEDERLKELLKRARKSSTPDCLALRDSLRGEPLSTIKLDAAPGLSEGIGTGKDPKKAAEARIAFEKKSMLRDWMDYQGNVIARGRMIDLRIGTVVLDVDGAQQKIPLSQLSDVDTNYVAELWNHPFRCGSGYEPLEGRNFESCVVQWKASGACHNPMYFEEIQLERYGHEAGPVLQPLISSAHFFLTLPILPYKMGINPPNECQYSLGYIRAGNCAPYMRQPFPWSLRGGLTQAAAVVGGAAVFP